jgi:DNA-binding protein YbaB
MSDDKPQVFLEGDEEIRGQKYVCLSFLTPNRGVLRNKELFFFSKFLEFFHMDYRIRSTESFLMDQFRGMQNTLSDIEMELRNTEVTDASANKSLAVTLSERLTKLRGEISKKTAEDLEGYVKANIADFKESTVVESYEKFMIVNRQRLEDEFHKQMNFQTTMHGLKVRGVYSNQEQANARAKALNKKDPYFNVYVADVGEWLPWDPEPEDVKDQEYQSDDLNKLMQAYRENAAKRDEFFEEDKRQKMAAAAATVKAHKEKQAAEKKAPTFGLQEEKAEVGSDMFSASGDLALERKRESMTHS